MLQSMTIPTVNVLHWRNVLQNDLLLQAFRQRELHQDAVNMRVVRQLFHDGLHVRLHYVLWQLVQSGLDANLQRMKTGAALRTSG